MKKLAVWIVMCAFLSMTVLGGCAYDKAYQSYSSAQADIAKNAGALIELHPNGQLKSVGNPMLAMMGMQMKAPKDAWESFFDFLKFATPFAAIYGIVGSMSTAMGSGKTTNVSGSNNLMGNTTGASSSFASPVTTTTTTTMSELPAIE